MGHWEGPIVNNVLKVMELMNISTFLGMKKHSGRTIPTTFNTDQKHSDLETFSKLPYLGVRLGIRSKDKLRIQLSRQY